MKKTLTKFLIILCLFILELGFINEYNEIPNNEEETSIVKNTSNKITLTKAITLVNPQILSFTSNENSQEYKENYIPYFAPQNTYYILTGIIKSIN